MDQLAKFPKRWELKELDLEKVLGFYRQALAQALPGRLRRVYAPISPQSLPYLYASFKRKCWKDYPDFVADNVQSLLDFGSRSMCKKEKHMCMRVIVSFIRLPYRRTFRYLGRAAMRLIETVWPSAAISNLSNAPNEIREATPKRWQTEECIRCKIVLEKDSKADTRDAGQAYEVMDGDFALFVFRSLREAAKKANLSKYIAAEKQ